MEIKRCSNMIVSSKKMKIIPLVKAQMINIVGSIIAKDGSFNGEKKQRHGKSEAERRVAGSAPG